MGLMGLFNVKLLGTLFVATVITFVFLLYIVIYFALAMVEIILQGACCM